MGFHGPRVCGAALCLWRGGRDGFRVPVCAGDRGLWPRVLPRRRPRSQSPGSPWLIALLTVGGRDGRRREVAEETAAVTPRLFLSVGGAARPSQVGAGVLRGGLL